MSEKHTGDQSGEQTGETVNRESHPNAGGPEGLAGDMGLSSERTGPFEGIEGTGSQTSAQLTTDGESPTDRAEGSLEDEVDLDKPDETSPISGVDRTVGEVQPDPVQNKHHFDPSRNPRH
ncbi:MAG: hypothetical protein ABI776_11150 [Nocardioidaceae bacterium]